MADSQNLTFAITAVDQVESAVARINKSIFSLGKSAKQVSQGSNGISSISVSARAAGIVARDLGEHGVRALERFGKAAEGVGTKLGTFSPALAGLTSIATLSGLGEITRRAAEFGASVARTSAQVGISQTELQRWSGAMFRMGFAAENTASMLGNVNKASLEARAGLNPQAWGIAQLKHINLTGNTTKTILSIADAIKRMHAEGQNAETEGQVLDAFGISRDHLALFEQGSAGIERLLDLRGQAGSLTDKEVGQLSRLDQSYRGLEQSASDFGKSIAASVAEPMMKAADATAAWLDELRQVPEVLKAVGAGATALSAVLSGAALGRLLFGSGTAGAGVFGLTALWAGGGAAAHSLGKEATGQILSGAGGAAGAAPGMPSVTDIQKALGATPSPSGPSLWDKIIDGLGIRSHGAAGSYRRGGIVPSARGGWIVPPFAFAGGGMPAILHPREMVLPAPISQGMQEMLREVRPSLAGPANWSRGDLTSAIDRIAGDIHGWIYGTQVPSVRLAELGPGIDTALGGVGIGVGGAGSYRSASAMPGSAVSRGGGAMGRARAAAPNDAFYNWASIRSGGGWAHFASPEAGVRGVRDLLMGGKSGRMYFGGGNDTLAGIISTWAPPNENNTRLLIDRASRFMNVDPSAHLNPRDPETMRRLVTAMISNEHGGVLPRDLDQTTIDKALGYAPSISPSGGRDLASAMERLPQFVSHQQLSNWCARLTNMALGAAGLPPITDAHGNISNIATDASAWGRLVDPLKGIQRGDLGVSMYGHRRGDLGGHVSVFTGRTRIGADGDTEYEVESSHSRILGGAGADWRHIGADDVTMVRRADSDADGTRDTSHEVTIHIPNAPQGTRAMVTGASGPSKLNLRTSYSMGDVW